ncbi:hypothetical protein FE784_20620 [Paenibacillus hemerocallicola]|uniref:CBM-cenC domain-containing protein n=1 Tax=Paenibacillus hemerocallicola TaxID=1172614 RepID=A0A5C4T6E1_9BACL|nr:carbohydrate binding domain-containing protein [Paenibacillus hemerocallicola]TNJ64375.1 hypothetical protein FE784_20620 [Paenibacillus hemerocallicola]
MRLWIRRNVSLTIVIAFILTLLPVFGPAERAGATGESSYGPNLLQNGSFETWSGGTPTSWTKVLAAGGTLSQETSSGNVQDGASSARLKAPAATGDSASLRQGGIAVTGGKEYRVSFYYKKPLSPATAYVYFKLTYRKSDGTAITPTTVEKLPTAEVANFTLFEKSFAAPADAVSVTYEFLMQRGAELIVDHASYAEVIGSTPEIGEGPNLLGNAGFDTWTSGQLNGWTTAVTGGGQVLLSNQAGYRLKSNAAELAALQSGDSAAVMQGALPVTGGQPYRATFTYRTEFVVGTAQLRVLFKDAAGQTLRTVSADLFDEEHDRFATLAELDGTAPANAVTAAFEATVSHGRVWIDEASFRTIPNLVANGSFESPLSGSDWSVASGPGTTGGSAVRVTAGGFDLNGAVTIETYGAQDEWSVGQSFVAQPDGHRRFKINALYKVQQTGTGAESFIRLTWLDANGQPIQVTAADNPPFASGQLPLSSFEAPVLKRDGEWHRLTQVLLKPAGAAKLEIRLVGRGGVSSVMWDGIQVEPWSDLYKVDGTPATDLAMAYDWSNEIEPDVFWSKIPAAARQTMTAPVWESELLRRHFFGLDGYYYLNYYTPLNNKMSQARIPYLEHTVGVSAATGAPSTVRAGDLPYNVTASPDGPNREYYAGGNQSSVGTYATLYTLTGEQPFLDRAEELMQFSHYSQYKSDGDNPFVRIHYPDEWQRLLDTGRNVQFRGGWDYKFNYNWTNVYGYTYPKHSPDGHVNAQIGGRMLHLYPYADDAAGVLNAVYEFAYNQIPCNGFNYGVYKNRAYYWFGYGPSTTGIPNDARNPLGDGTDNINAAKAHVFAKVGYLRNDPKMLELARGLLWYLAREYEYDGAFYYDSAENPLNKTRAVLDQSHETMMVWDAMHAFAYLKQAGVDIGAEEAVWKEALDTTVDSALWYQGDRYIKALKAFDGTPAPNSQFTIATYLQAIGDGPYTNVKWFDKLGSNMVVPQSLNVRISKVVPPSATESDWTVDPGRDVVYAVTPDSMANDGIVLPWMLQKGDIYRVVYTATTGSGFDRNADTMPNAGAAFYLNGGSGGKLEIAEAMAPPMLIDLNVNASNLLSFPAQLYFPFPNAASAAMELPAAPAAQAYASPGWRTDSVGDAVTMHFKHLAPTVTYSTYSNSIYGQVSFSRYIEYAFYLPRTSEGEYDVALERLNGSIAYSVSIDGQPLAAESLVSTGLRTSVADLGSVTLEPGWHTIRFDTPGSMGILNVKFTALSVAP